MPRFHALPAPSWIWPLCLCLLASLSACSTSAPTRGQSSPPPAELATPCWPGPAWPEEEGATLGELLEVVYQREAAAAECRARHRALVRAWPSQ